jgi:hypothetical protein
MIFKNISPETKTFDQILLEIDSKLSIIGEEDPRGKILVPSVGVFYVDIKSSKIYIGIRGREWILVASKIESPFEVFFDHDNHGGFFMDRYSGFKFNFGSVTSNVVKFYRPFEHFIGYFSVNYSNYSKLEKNLDGFIIEIDQLNDLSSISDISWVAVGI